MRLSSIALTIALVLMGCATAAPLNAAAGEAFGEVAAAPRDSTPSRADSVESEMALVRGRYDQIRRELRGYEQIERDMRRVGLLDDVAVEQGRLQAYFEGRELRKVIATRFDESGYSIHEVAYWDGAPFLMIFTRVSRPRAEGERAVRTEDYFYFTPQGELLRWFGNGTRAEGEDRARRMQRLAAEYSAVLQYEQPVTPTGA